jgi:hypothetical protein
MSTLVDTDTSIVDDADSLFTKLQSEAQPQEAMHEASQDEGFNEPAVPEKFRGKRMEDVVRSYEELEKQFGKQGQELGELRKITDEFIKRQLTNSPPQEDTYRTQEFDLDENDPTVSTVDRIIEKKLGPVLKELHETKKEKMTAKLKELHPDFVDIVTDTNFVDWVKASPIRTELYIQADTGYDPDAANELFSVWKERKGIKNTPTASTKVDETALRNATMETGSATDTGGEKVYRRADIVNLMRTNPARYQQLESEIRRAYSEGRVR